MHIVAIGGSDAGISAALRARELDPTVDVEPAVHALIGPAAPVDGDGTEA